MPNRGDLLLARQAQPDLAADAANGTTINLTVGTQALLALDSDHDWTVMVADPTVLMPVVGAAVPAGAQSIYAASAQ